MHNCNESKWNIAVAPGDGGDDNHDLDDTAARCQHVSREPVAWSVLHPRQRKGRSTKGEPDKSVEQQHMRYEADCAKGQCVMHEIRSYDGEVGRAVVRGTGVRG